MHKCHFTRSAYSLKVNKLIYEIFIGQLLFARLSARPEVSIMQDKCPHLHGYSRLVRKTEIEKVLSVRNVI